MKFFCINCGDAITYSIKKPDTCPSCKHVFGSTSTPKSQSQPTISTFVEEKKPDFEKLEILVDEAPKPTMIEDLAYQRVGSTDIVRRSKGPGGGQRVLEEIQKDLQSSR